MILRTITWFHFFINKSFQEKNEAYKPQLSSSIYFPELHVYMYMNVTNVSDKRTAAQKNETVFRDYFHIYALGVVEHIFYNYFINSG